MLLSPLSSPGRSASTTAVGQARKAKVLLTIMTSVLALGWPALPLRADLVFITSTGPYPATTGQVLAASGLRDGFSTQNDYAGTLGHTFTVGNVPLLVTGLGYYDGPNSAAANVSGYTGDGLLNPHEVGIWAATTQTLIASATVPAGTTGTLIDDFRYLPIKPVLLAARGQYVVGGQVTLLDLSGAGDVFRNDADVDTFGPGLTVNYGSYAFSGALGSGNPNNGAFEFPNVQFQSGYDGGSFEYALVPEPSSWALAGVGLLGLFSGRVLCRRIRSVARPQTVPGSS
jgi:PEP-CTERM motif